MAELLIVLGIMALIAALTIPGVLSGQQASQKKAVFRETTATFSIILAEGLVKKVVETPASFRAFLNSKVNALKICDTNSSTQGCWDTATQGTYNSQETQPGYVLHNGATVAGVDLNQTVANQTVTSFLIDWNGALPPNTVGDDQLNVVYCIGPNPCTSWIQGGAPQRPGAFGPSGAPSVSLFQQIYQ